MSKKGIYDNSYNETELTKSAIDYSKFIVDDREQYEGYKDMENFIIERNFAKYVSEKKNKQQYLSSKDASYIFIEVYNNSVPMASALEVYDCVSRHFNIDGTEFYNALIPKIQEIIKKSFQVKHGNICLDRKEKKFKTSGKIRRRITF